MSFQCIATQSNTCNETIRKSSKIKNLFIYKMQ